MSSENGQTPRCGAETRRGGVCLQPAGAGTPHPGTGSCKWHGGSTRSHLLAAARQEARALGNVVDVEPHEALLYCVQRSAGDVAFYESKIAALEDEAIVGAPLSTTTTAERSGEEEKVSKRQHEHPVDVNIWVRLRDQALDRLARFAKMAIDAGIEERQVALSERLGAEIAGLVEALFDALGTPPEARAKALPVVQARMIKLESDRAA